MQHTCMFSSYWALAQKIPYHHSFHFKEGAQKEMKGTNTFR